MSTLDPMAVAVDWFDFYRAASLSIVNLYSDNAALECGCGGAKVLYGRSAITAYWQQRFTNKPAGTLRDLKLRGKAVVLSYYVADGIVEVTFYFDDDGKIAWSQCEPTVEILSLRPKETALH